MKQGGATLVAMRFLLVLLGALVLAPVDDALVEFQKAFKRTRNVAAVQERRELALAAFTTPSGALAGEALVRAYVQCENDVFEAEERHRKYILHGTRDKVREPRPGIDGLRGLQETLLARICGLEDADAAQAALGRTILAKKLPLHVRLAAATRAGVAGDAAPELVQDAFKKARKPADMLVALTAAEALGPAATGAGPAIIANLRGSSTTLREAAARAAAATLLPATIEPLVAQLNTDRGRTRVRIASALQVMTGRNLGASPSAWRAWLEKEGAPYVKGEEPLGQGDPVVLGGVPDEGGTYYGIPLTGETILFVLDTSQSMNAALNKKEPDAGSRIERARAELCQALGQLKPEQRFDVVGFGGTLVSFSGEFLPATAENIAAGQEWVTSERLTLGTRMYDAFDLAFARAGRPVADTFYELSIDTIFMLTDGYPIVNGKRDSNDRIRQAVRGWNLNARVVVHTIALGKGVPAKFLRLLAEENGGRFVHEGK